jgi:hypothetical protein
MAGINKIFTQVTKRQCLEFGLLVVLATIYAGLHFKEQYFFVAAFIATLLIILWPFVFYPFAVIWFAIIRGVSFISSWFIMLILFFVVVTPVGLFRRMTGRDTLQLKQFKKGRQSVMTDINHTYTKTDLLHTF